MSQSFFFGEGSRRLYGVYSPPTGEAASCGVVLCPPWGQEYLRAHRPFRILADMLARAGIHALRFDYFGTGDSAGDSEDADLDGWVDDVETAIDELHSLTGVRRVGLVGLRLGAALAALAAGRRREVRRLALWDPIVDGRRYVARLLDQARSATAAGAGAGAGTARGGATACDWPGALEAGGSPRRAGSPGVPRGGRNALGGCDFVPPGATTVRGPGAGLEDGESAEAITDRAIAALLGERARSDADAALDAWPEAGWPEVDGFPLTGRLREALLELDAERFDVNRGVQVMLALTEETDEAQRLADVLERLPGGPIVEYRVVRGPRAWVQERDFGAGAVPAAVLAAIADWSW